MQSRKTRPTQLVPLPPTLADEPTESLIGTLVVLTGPEPGQSFGLERSQNIIGRSPSATISIDDPGISRQHASVFNEGNAYYIEDMGSTNGTYLNNERIEQRRRIHSGMRIQLGSTTVLRFAVRDRLEQEASERMYEMSVRDSLTGLYNRRYFEDRLASEMAYMRRHKTPTCVMLVDVDHFKNINDTWGHAAGDEALRRIAHALAERLRAEDVIARVGGEEMIVLARGTELEGGRTLAERMRHTIEQLDVPWEGKPIKLTISIGIAHTDIDPRLDRPEAIVAAADGALYRAKHLGRNRVVVATPHLIDPKLLGAAQEAASPNRPWDRLTTPKKN